MFAAFSPPPDQNHSFDVGVYPGGLLNPPAGEVYFYQFGVSSAYPVTSSTWKATMTCPTTEDDGAFSCIPAASYISGFHSYWKVIYSFGRDYEGLSFEYLGNYTVVFEYIGKSPSDSTPIW
jgi:hypothetical protein